MRSCPAHSGPPALPGTSSHRSAATILPFLAKSVAAGCHCLISGRKTHGHFSLSRNRGIGVLKDTTKETNRRNPTKKTQLTGAARDSCLWHSFLEEQVMQEHRGTSRAPALREVTLQCWHCWLNRGQPRLRYSISFGSVNSVHSVHLREAMRASFHTQH